MGHSNRKVGSSNRKLGKRIFLYVFSIAMLVAAVLIILNGFGILANIPGFVIWALILITIGIGILSGISS